MPKNPFAFDVANKKENYFPKEIVDQFYIHLRNYPTVKYSKNSVKGLSQEELLNVDNIVDSNSPEYQEIVQTNDALRTTAINQAKYVLGEIAKLTGREKEFDKEVKSKKADNSFLREFSIWVEHYRQSPKDKDDVFVSSDKISKIIQNSCLEENIGKVDQKFVDIYNYNVSGEYKKDKRAERRQLGLDLVKHYGYTKEELDDAFTSCFYEDEPDFDIEDLRKATEKVILDKMGKLPENERSEQKFIEESEKLELIMKCHVFPHNKINPSIVAIKGGHTSNVDYYPFAYKAVPPTATAKTCQDEFNEKINAYKENGPLDESDLVDLVKPIKHLKIIHKDRPFWSRVRDYFRKDGEDSTIKRLTKRLIAEGFTSKQVNKAISVSRGAVDYKTIFERGQELINPEGLDTQLKITEDAINFHKEEDLKRANAEIQKGELKNEITNELNREKEEEKEILIEEGPIAKDNQKVEEKEEVIGMSEKG